MNNKKKNEGQTDFSYYGLYLLDYLRNEQVLNRLPTMYSYGSVPTVPPKRMSVRGSKAIRPKGAGVGDAHAPAGLRYSKYAILREVVENEFADDVPEAERDPLPENCFRLSVMYSPSMTFRTTISPCRPITTCSIRS